MRLTDLSIRSLKAPTKGAKLYADDTLPGFGVRVSQAGTKSFTLTYGVARERATIGRVGIITLADARAAAKRFLAERTLGKGRVRTVSFEAASTLFFEHCDEHNKGSTAKETKRLITKYALPGFRNMHLETITHEDIAKRLAKLKSTPGTANHVFAALRTFFNWTVPRYLPHSPMDGMDMPFRTVSRDRVLTADELKKLWGALETTEEPYRSIVRLLLLTGQRREEIGQLEQTYIDNQAHTITLPASLTKNGREHTLPYGPLAQTILEGNRNNSLLFPSRKTMGKAFSGYSKCKARLDDLLNFPPWRLHDLRRTFATNLAALGTPIHVTEALLNHVSGTKAGIVGVYQRHHYMPEMKAAIERWEQYLTVLVSGTVPPA